MRVPRWWTPCRSVEHLPGSGGAEGGFDAGVDLGLGELGGDTDAVHDGALVGGAVADDADTADAQQGRAAELRVVEALLEVVEGAAGEQGPELRGDGGFEGLAQQDATRRAVPSQVLMATLPTKPSQTMTSARPLKRSRPSTLPMKFMPGRAWSRGKVSWVRELPLLSSSPIGAGRRGDGRCAEHCARRCGP